MKPLRHIKIAGRHQKRASDLACQRSSRQAGNEDTAQAVRNNVHDAMTQNGPFQPVTPPREHRVVPVVLLDQRRPWMVVQPVTLPVARA
ncbi:hypothetical protein D3C72_2188460 [compost metagenome]